MAKTAVIIQARMNSTRLPGKVLLNLAGWTVLRHVVTRAKAISGADAIVCAVPETHDSDEVAAEALRCGAEVYRGSEQDVLARYHGAARMVDADVIVRITSDCPLIDPAICGQVLTLRQSTNSDYACNNMPAAFPHGLDCEVFTMALLQRAAAEASQPEQREHVTPWMRVHPGIRRASLAGPDQAVTELRWTLDFPEDFTFFTELLRFVQPSTLPAMPEILQILQDHPELAAFNRQHHGVSRPTVNSL